MLTLQGKDEAEKVSEGLESSTRDVDLINGRVGQPSPFDQAPLDGSKTSHYKISPTGQAGYQVPIHTLCTPARFRRLGQARHCSSAAHTKTHSARGQAKSLVTPTMYTCDEEIPSPTAM